MIFFIKNIQPNIHLKHPHKAPTRSNINIYIHTHTKKTHYNKEYYNKIGNKTHSHSQNWFCSLAIEFGVKFNFLLKIYANYMKRWLKYVIFGGHHMCFGLISCIELSPKLKLKFEIN